MTARTLMLLAALGLPALARADEPQYRKLTLVDGRVLTAEILSTEPQGLLLNRGGPVQYDRFHLEVSCSRYSAKT